MPDSEGPGHVQVFHFTNRISKKKISKYETASRRGMSNGDGHLATTPPSDASGPVANLDGTNDNMANGTNPPESSPDSDRPPPPKRLKLYLKKPADQPPASSPAEEKSDVKMPDARPSRRVASRRRSRQAEVIPDPHFMSSELSSLASTSPPPSSRPSSMRNRDYGDFMNYYIMDNDDDDMDDQPNKATPSVQAPKKKPIVQPVEKLTTKPAADHPTSAKPKPKRKPRASKTNELEQQHVQPSIQHPLPQNMPHQPQMPQQPLPAPAPAPTLAPQQPIAIPTIVLIDLDQEPSIQVPGKRDSVQEMIAKLQDLSRALTPFAGMPELSQPVQPTIPKKKAPPKKPITSDNPIDGFLDMFEVDSSEDEDQQPQPRASLDYHLQKPGEPDHALAYGIQFIMNALRSWANQRLQSQFNQQFLEATQRQQAEYQQQQFRRGRPPKHAQGRSGTQPMALPDMPSEIHMSLTNTPEGHAVRAFQEVLRSGSLQMNAALPTELTQALTRIYMQIDRLINQGAKQDPPWQPHSYTAQIEAHRLRVTKFQEDQAQEAALQQQQQMHDQQALARMHLGGQIQQMQPAYSPEQQALDIQRQRNSQYLQQQHSMSPPVQAVPHTYALHPPPPVLPPLQQAPPPHPTPSHPHPQPVQQQQLSPPKPAERYQEATVKSPTIATSVADKRKSAGPAPAMSNIKMYMPGWLPRSGTQMKFSFSPTQVPYGQQQTQGSPPAHMAPPPGQRMEAASPPNGSIGEEIVVAPSNRGTKSETPAHPSHKVVQANSPAAGVPTSIPASPALGSTSTTVSRMQSAPMDIASRFPHPGAVIVDR